MSEPKAVWTKREQLEVSFDGERPTGAYTAKRLPWGDSDVMYALRSMFNLGIDDSLVALEMDAEGIRGIVELGTVDGS